MAENDEDAASEQDVRLAFISEYVLKTLKLKSDRWTKMISLEESRQTIMEFLDKSEPVSLIIYQNQQSQLFPSHDFPPSTKTKSVYFVKKEKTTVSNQNMKNVLTFGDLSYTPLEQLSALVDDVLLPLLGNSSNHGDWPSVVCQDVMRHVQELKNSVFVVAGQVKGKTLLPLPPQTGNVTEAADREQR
jgi:dynein heavy chain